MFYKKPQYFVSAFLAVIIALFVSSPVWAVIFEYDNLSSNYSDNGVPAYTNLFGKTVARNGPIQVALAWRMGGLLLQQLPDRVQLTGGGFGRLRQLQAIQEEPAMQQLVVLTILAV